jgi:uncharacterized delta-60 repeat protein
MCFSQSASFDSSFGTNGKVLINRCPNSYGIFAVDLQSDEKIVHGFGGYSNVYAIFSRSNSNGILDATFGTNGYYELSTITTNVLQPESNYTMVEFEVQNDNKIVSAGRRESISASTFCVSRILANGGLDTSFNGTGFLEVSFGAGTSRGNCMKLQSNGKILVGGRSGSSSQFFSLLRLNTDGSFDTTFGSAGKVQTLMIGQSLPNSIAIQTDGKILMGGYVLNNPYGYDFAVVRYLVNGTLDTSFGVNGIVITTINTFYNDVINKVLVQNDGKIIVVGNNADGTGESRMAMVRYNSNGAVDTTFANNGIYISGYYGGANDAAFQVDGKIVCSGSVFTSDYLFNVVRFNVNGIIDDDFLLSNVSNPFNYSSGSFSLLIQPDNKIVAGGVAGIDETCQVSLGAIIRINPGTLSNEEFSKTKTVVYPNPTSSNVFFDNSVNQYENGSVYNYLGQEILKQELGFSSSESINISTIANGVYLLKFNNEKGSETIKIVKEKH